MKNTGVPEGSVIKVCDKGTCMCSYQGCQNSVFDIKYDKCI